MARTIREILQTETIYTDEKIVETEQSTTLTRMVINGIFYQLHRK